MTLTIVLLTKDEEIHIARCLESIKPIAERICIVDSGSTDSTIQIATRFGAEVFENPWVNYATQFQWALENCGIETDWTMRMDADEYVDEVLQKEILELKTHEPSQTNGYFIRRKVYFMDSWIRWGGHYPQTLLRIWQSGKGAIEDKWMDEHIVLDNPVTERLRGHIVDHNLKDITWWIDKHNGYATREVKDILAMDRSVPPGAQAKAKRFLKNNIYLKLPTSVRSTMYFLYRYFVRLGFLDGKAGFYYHFLQGYWYRCLVDLKLEEELNKSTGSTMSAAQHSGKPH